MHTEHTFCTDVPCNNHMSFHQANAARGQFEKITFFLLLLFSSTVVGKPSAGYRNHHFLVESKLSSWMLCMRGRETLRGTFPSICCSDVASVSPRKVISVPFFWVLRFLRSEVTKSLFMSFHYI